MKESMGSSKKPATKIKVSQATIDKIKKMGMTRALSGAKSANPEMKEALTRMYGARRVSAASTSAKSAPKGAVVDMGKTTPKMPGKGPAVKMAKAGRKPAFGGTAAQKAQAAARAGGNINMNRTVPTTPVKKSPSKPYVAPKPTAQQMAQAKARAGANVNLTPKPKPKTVETAADRAAKAALAKKRREAMTAAVKRAGGRTL